MEINAYYDKHNLLFIWIIEYKYMQQSEKVNLICENEEILTSINIL